MRESECGKADAGSECGKANAGKRMRESECGKANAGKRKKFYIKLECGEKKWQLPEDNCHYKQVSG